MNFLTKSLWSFTILFASCFVLDVITKLYLDAFPYRYISKTLLIAILLVFFLKNNKEVNQKKITLVTVALLCFIIGDILLIGSETKMVFAIGVCFFATAKVLYCIRFLNEQDFKMLKLIPFLLFCFAYMTGIMLLVYDNLGPYFIPALLYLFIVMMVAQFAYLRKNEVNTLSYIFVLLGIILSMFSDSITLLKEFYDETIAYHKVTVMLFYGLSQYFIIIGIIMETNKMGMKSSLLIKDSSVQ